MAIRYPPEVLFHLRNSPLCVKPDHLPPADDWMGPPQEQQQQQQQQQQQHQQQPQLRTQSKLPNDRSRNDGSILNGRPTMERHLSRNSTNPEDIIFGPPRTAFASSRGKTFDDKNGKDGESQGRFGIRGRSGDFDGEGWSTVKPRKSFGAEGAERFAGKMGGNFRDEKKPQRDGDRTTTTRDRTSKGLDGIVRDADSENRQQRNGLGRSKLESWHKSESESVLSDRKDRDRTRSWRDRDPDAARNDDRRWGGRDRDQRAERDPEWFDEPAQEKKEAHTQQDFQKWMEQMKKAKIAASGAPDNSTEAAEARIEAEKPAVKSAPAVEAGPDKFFMAFGGSSTLEQNKEPEQKEVVSKPKGGKSSRFTSFFSQPQEEPVRQGPPAAAATAPLPSSGPPDLAALLAARPPPSAHPADDKQAFQQLLAKLQKQTMSATPPGLSLFSPPPQQQPQGDRPGNGAVASPGPYPQRGERRDASGPQEILAPRPQQQSARPEQLLRDFASGQHQRTTSQGSSTAPRDNTSARNNSNTEFLMNLMRGPHSQSNTPKQHQQPQQPPPHHEEADGRSSQQQRRPQPPPGFQMEDSYHSASGDSDSRTGQQPTQILQRPPPGLDQMPPGWMPPPPGQRGAGGPMMPPPGLRGGPMPPMFPPNFPPGAIPPPPGNMPMPPPGFFNGHPPHGFGPLPGMPGFNGPPPGDPHAAFGSPPFEGRGMPHPPPGRGYNRQ